MCESRTELRIVILVRGCHAIRIGPKLQDRMHVESMRQRAVIVQLEIVGVDSCGGRSLIVKRISDVKRGTIGEECLEGNTSGNVAGGDAARAHPTGDFVTEL